MLGVGERKQDTARCRSNGSGVLVGLVSVAVLLLIVLVLP